MILRPFHLAIPVTDIQIAHDFYVKILDCKVGRQAKEWMDFDFFGHQLVAHLVSAKDHPAVTTNSVDGHAVPASHFGVILDWQDFENFGRI